MKAYFESDVESLLTFLQVRDYLVIEIANLAMSLCYCFNLFLPPFICKYFFCSSSVPGGVIYRFDAQLAFGTGRPRRFSFEKSMKLDNLWIRFRSFLLKIVKELPLKISAR